MTSALTYETDPTDGDGHAVGPDSAMGPLVGITGARMHSAVLPATPRPLIDTWTDAYLAPYPRVVAEAGGVPVQLPRDAPARALVERVDGLVLAGGQDVDPRLYGAFPTPNSTPLDPRRDRFELDLINVALDLGKPFVGICRGAQLLNVALGGALIGDLTGAQAEEHTSLSYPAYARVHAVRFKPGTVAHSIYGDEASVNSFHRQAIHTAGAGVTVSGVAPDGVVEAIDVNAHALGVQWHPELLGDVDPLFAWLVGEATPVGDATPVGVMESR